MNEYDSILKEKKKYTEEKIEKKEANKERAPKDEGRPD